MSEEPEKVELETPDLAAEKRAALDDLVPGVIADGVLDGTRLGELLDTPVTAPADGRERFGLMWAGKQEAVRSLLAPSRGTLIPAPESVASDTAQNVFIEGDNLEVLKLLQKAYNDRVKLIYIDPPYNTGNDFVYEDNFNDGLRGYLKYTGQLDAEGNRTSSSLDRVGRFHSRWLSMMYPRLALARNLLTQDGIFVASIDDHEVHSLRSLLDEIFGPENFLGMITRSTGTPTGGGFEGLVNLVDYLLVYARSDEASLRGLDFTEEDASIYSDEDERGRYLTRPLRRTGGEDRREDRPSMYYGVTAPDGSIVYPIAPGGYESRWRCGKDRYLQMEHEDLIQWKQQNEGGVLVWKPYQKFYLGERTKRPSNLWTDIEGNKKATRDVRDLFGGQRVFETPKPVHLIQRVVQIATSDSDLVLDFFAGSGTTAHAVAKQNAEDGGNRRVISVNIQEPTPVGSDARKAGYTTVSAIALARIRAVLDVFTDARAHGLRTFRLEQSSFRQPVDPDTLLDLSAKTLRDGEMSWDAIAAEVLLKEGVVLDAPWTRHDLDGVEVVVADGVAVVLTASIDSSLVEAALPLAARVVVFLEDGFAGADAVKANAATNAKNLGITLKTV